MSFDSGMALPAQTRFLNPGEWAVGGEGDVFGTLLGSCVALVLWHPAMRIGSICHYILPQRERPLAGALDGRYGVEVLGMMSKALAGRGVTLAQCTARLFGGARVYEVDGHRQTDIGAANIRCANEFLRRAGLLLTAQHVGGRGWRRLAFDAGTGEVSMRFNTQRMRTLSHEDAEAS